MSELIIRPEYRHKSHDIMRIYNAAVYLDEQLKQITSSPPWCKRTANADPAPGEKIGAGLTDK